MSIVLNLVTFNLYCETLTLTFFLPKHAVPIFVHSGLLFQVMVSNWNFVRIHKPVGFFLIMFNLN